jgi:hypothetical protein
VTEYHEFVRRWASWSQEHVEITVGNYEAMFGRGLLLRAFELPGVVREEFGTPQYGDSRDLDGVRVRAMAERGEVMALAGEPRFSDQDPTKERRGQVEGATATLRPVTGVNAGGNYLRLDTRGSGPGSRLESGGAFLQLGFDPYLERAGFERLSLDTYIEYDRVTGLDLPPVVSSPRARLGQGYGLYFAQSVVLDEPLPGWRWGASYETKDYQNLELGVNEPPTLVREHAFALLNRSTHVLRPLQEQGYQFETRFNYRNMAELVLNWSRAENARSRQFHERYQELSAHWRGSTLTLFADQAADEIEDVQDRDTWGIYGQALVHGPHSIEIDMQLQNLERGPAEATASIEDRYGSLTYSWAGRFSAAYVRQTTDDPSEATDPATGDVTRRAYDSFNASVDVGSHHQVQAFFGRRRGGLACVAGTCYKVRAFEGVAAQLMSRF